MPLEYHPKPGTVVKCNYGKGGFIDPEMIKNRLAIVISPQISQRHRLCTIVPLSLTPPDLKMPYHFEITFDQDLPAPWEGRTRWVKADMVFAASFSRLELLRTGKSNGKRNYDFPPIDNDKLNCIKSCVLCSLGLSSLTKHLKGPK